jgi:hypothetical protein
MSQREKELFALYVIAKLDVQIPSTTLVRQIADTVNKTLDPRFTDQELLEVRELVRSYYDSL